MSNFYKGVCIFYQSSDGTASIKGIQIRTGERGYILRYRQENLKLSKQVEKLQMDNKGSKTASEITFQICRIFLNCALNQHFSLNYSLIYMCYPKDR